MIIRCIVCNKPVKASAEMVLMRTDGYLFGPDYESQVPPAQDQGWFEIGPDCLKRVLATGPRGLRL